MAYRVNQQPEGTRVTYWPDPRGPNHGSLYWGTVIQHTGTTVLIAWDNEDEFFEVWDSAEIRYRIDRGQMRLIRPAKPPRLRIPADQLACKVCGKPRQLKCGCPRPGATKPEEWGSRGQLMDTSSFTRGQRDDIMSPSHRMSDDESTKGSNTMGTKKTTKGTTKEVTPDEAPTSNKLSAKEAAALIGTDARTLRKFLRSESGLVGQGQRWEIDPDKVDELKARFTNFTKAKGESTAKKAKSKDAPARRVSQVDADELEDDDELEGLMDLDDLDDLEDL